MRRDLSELIEHAVLSTPYSCRQWDMASEESVDEYLKVDMEIWVTVSRQIILLISM